MNCNVFLLDKTMPAYDGADTPQAVQNLRSLSSWTELNTVASPSLQMSVPQWNDQVLFDGAVALTIWRELDEYRY